MSQSVSYLGEEVALEQKIEREWKSIRCPRGKDKTLVMVEWNIVLEKGRILKRILRQIDCHHPQRTRFGGEDCEWGCERVIGERQR
jgi:hypothetical protein